MSRSVSKPPNSLFAFYFDVSEYDEFQSNELAENLIDLLTENFKSLYNNSNQWLGREDLILVSNKLAYIGISEYCGLLCIWFVPRDDKENFHTVLGNTWLQSIHNKAQKLLSDYFGEKNTLMRIGAFSNGETIYERKGA